jgi:hypothetical protein
MLEADFSRLSWPDLFAALALLGKRIIRTQNYFVDGTILEADAARRTIKRLANGFERGKTNRPRLIGFQNRKVIKSNTCLFGQFRQFHLPIPKRVI